MEIKDYVTIGISSAALIISIVSNIFQKRKENVRVIRKTLSDSLESLTKIDLEIAKLNKDASDSQTKEMVNMRRLYNGQRRALLVHVDFLSTQYPKIITEADCNIMAISFNSIGDYQKAEDYWKKTIDYSYSVSMKHMNLRGYARFLYYQGRLEQGRSKYKEALEIALSDTDNNRRIMTDTYIMWSETERDFDNIPESTRLLENAKSSCARIGHKKMREQMEGQIRRRVPSDEKI